MRVPSPDRNSLPLRFGIVGDSHYAETPMRRNRYYTESVHKMRECVDVMNRERVEFLVHLGDLKDQDEPPDENRTLAYLQAINTELRRFSGPVHYVLGNHDMDSISKAQFLAAVGQADAVLTPGHASDAPIRSEPPRNAAMAAAAPHGSPAAGPTAACYSFDRGGRHFVILDANHQSSGADYDHGHFDWTDANVPQAHLEWLIADLAAHGDVPTIVFCHQLLDGSGDYYVNNASEVRATLESGNVLAAFQGHRHAGGYSEIGGIHYYTLRAMVAGSGAENSSYAIVEVTAAGRGGARVSVSGYRRAESMDFVVTGARPRRRTGATI